MNFITDPDTGAVYVSMDDWASLAFVPTLEAIAEAELREGKQYTGPRPAPLIDLPGLVAQLAITQEAVDFLILNDLLGGL